MIEPLSLAEANAKLSVPINGVLTPFKKIPENLQRYCRPLMFHREDAVFDLAYSGSCFLFRHGKHHLQLSTKHQLRMDGGDLKPEDACLIIPVDEGHVGLSPNGASRLLVHNTDDLLPQDILLLEYERHRGRHDLGPLFVGLDLDQTRTVSEVSPDSIRLAFSIGYPFARQAYEPVFDDDWKATSLKVISRPQALIFDEKSFRPSYEDSREAISAHPRYGQDIGDPNGWSGAPVFFVWGDDNKDHHLGFAGMITHGSSHGGFMLYRAEDIRNFVNGAINTPYPASVATPDSHGMV
ncbi:hypothetical protein [Rhizobium anhuiense]|uniref:hypothetical protein n=1 Tax=Rhizobium anhuiense TaxID=1184720 RepID=UPI000BEAAE08|nr:hypothetical protein [Rhizobium anhuiense]